MTSNGPLLDFIIARQLKLQTDSFGIDPRDLKANDRMSFVSWNALALTDELHEALNEVGWRPWASSRHMNVTEFRAELVDALHFFVNLWMTSFESGTSPEDMALALYEGYIKKAGVNAQRQEDGYDGVSSKCPGCKRELGETKLFWDDHDDNGNGLVKRLTCVCGMPVPEAYEDAVADRG